ncbi:uncharacterized protein LOC141621584 [Silene latifolia]|uniref:uncharacterized protein LOC141621584 n=1 Tax=Silene latifolia TaxID=37657 RepID=UPI003D77BB38
MEEAKMLKAIMAAVIMTAMLFSSISAADITVGCATGWDLSTKFTYWSSSTPVNDSLEFIYTRTHYVTEANFATCDITTPIAAYYDINGKTLINLTKPGPRYFICGRSNHCTLGLKLHIHVLERLQTDTSSPNYPVKQAGERSSPGDGPHNEHKKHSPDSSCGEKSEDAVRWVRFVLMISCYVVLFRLDDAKFTRMVMRVYRLYILDSLLRGVAEILVADKFSTDDSEKSEDVAWWMWAALLISYYMVLFRFRNANVVKSVSLVHVFFIINSLLPHVAAVLVAHYFGTDHSKVKSCHYGQPW